MDLYASGPGVSGYLPVDSIEAMPPDANVLIIPLKNAGRLFMIEAIIDNEQGNLIFDTGANELVLNNTYFRKYLRRDASPTGGITGNVGETARITTKSMNVSGLRYSKVPALLSNLSHIENRYGVKVLGLFGFQLIRGYEIVIDLHRNELQLYRIDNKGNRVPPLNDTFNSDHLQKIEDDGNIVFIRGTVGGKALRFCLDTGAETNAIDRHSSGQVLQTISVRSKTNLSGAGASKTEVLVGTMNDFRIGESVMRNMTTVITNLDALEEAYNQPMDGILGYDFLMKGPVCINFVKDQFLMKITDKEQ